MEGLVYRGHTFRPYSGRMISCSKLGKRYGDRWLFRNLDFEVNVGDCLVILGKNGAGKSTLTKILAGLVPATEGTCTRPPDIRNSLGYAALDQAVYPMLTVGEHLDLAGRLRGVAPRVDELLETVGLRYAKENLGKTLSTGMRARLKFALAVQSNPAVIMFDEPGAGLDDEGRQMVARLIEQHRSTSAIIIATNDPLERRFATLELDLV